MKKVLFLDFDGVLHPATGDSVPEFSKASALARAMHGYACGIVISSTWRLHYPLDELKDFLPAGLAERVIGTTGDDPRSHFARHDSILAWLAQEEAVDWRALDDAAAEFREGGHLIACNPEVGLEDGQLLELERWLADPASAGMVVLPCGDLAMARYCVSFDEYDAYARATGAPLPDDGGWGRGNMPVVNVTWDDARRYAQWLAGLTGRPYRLPSDAEWEHAARAGTTTAYWWGDVPDIDNANYIDTPGGGPFSVDSLEPNPWGLYNMHGNVSEWVEDATKEGLRVLRGGNYHSNAHEISSSARGQANASYSGGDVGFRVALTVADHDRSNNPSMEKK